MAFTFGGGNSSGFGSGGTTFGQQSNAFGGGNAAFGAKPPAFGSGGGFGTSPNSGTSAFGGSSTPFGGGNQNTMSGGFGSTTNSSPFSGGNAAGGTSFGSSNTTSSFGGGSVFGGSNTASNPFGGGANTTAAFGTNSTSAFGASANAFGSAQKPGGVFSQQNNATGAFGSSSGGFGSSTTTGFGFGSSNTQTSSPFGASPSSSPFGAAPSTPSVFGQSSTAQGTFGQPSTNAFGTSGGMFGQPASSGFGSTTTQQSPFGAASTQASAFGTTPAFGSAPSSFGSTMGSGAQQVGTGSPPYQTTSDPDMGSGNGRFISISAMQQYKNKSLDELRYEDYLKKTNPQAAQALAASAPSSTSTATGFGATASPFGAPTPSATSTSPFGTASPATSGFGATASNPFAPKPGGVGATTGGFGTTTPAQPASTGFSFGSTPAPSNAFGSTAQSTGFSFSSTAPTATGFGATSAAATPGTGFGGFGATATTQPASTGFSFGNTAAKPAASSPAFGGFGSSNSFGSTSLGGTTPAAGGFSFGGGSTANAKPAGSLFSASTPSTFGSSGFGAASTTPGTSLFGGSTFGATGSNTTTGSSLFGGSTSGTSLFGSSQQPAGAQTQGSLFGSTPAAGTSFFGASTPTTGMFGATSSPQPGTQPTQLVAGHNTNPYGAGAVGAGLVEQQVKAALALPVPQSTSGNTVGVGLSRSVAESSPYGSKHSGPNSYRYTPKGRSRIRTRGAKSANESSASTLISQPGGKGSLFDGSFDSQILSPDVFKSKQTKVLVIDNSQPANGAKTGKGDTNLLSYDYTPKKLLNGSASINHDPIAVSPDSLKSKNTDENVVSLRYMKDGKTDNYMVNDTLTVSELKDKVADKYNRRYTASVARNQVIIICSGKLLNEDTLVSKLNLTSNEVLDICINEEEPRNDSDKISRGADSNTIKRTPLRKPTPSKSRPASSIKSPPRSSFVSYDDFYSSAIKEADNQKHPYDNGDTSNKNAPRLTRYNYYTIPDISLLKKMTDEELHHVRDFAVGNEGVGRVTWFGETDVFGLDLDDLIEFRPKEITVYKDESTKHPLGEGLNRPALVELHGVFPSKSTPEGKQKYYERVKRRTEKLDATFVDYDATDGIWKFRTEHFSRYGIDDDDESSDENEAMDATMTGKAPKQVSTLPAHLHMDSDRLQTVRQSLFVNTQSRPNVTTFANIESGINLKRVDEPEPEQRLTLRPSEPPVTLALPAPNVIHRARSVTKVFKPLGIDADTRNLPELQKSDTYQMSQKYIGNKNVFGQSSNLPHVVSDSAMLMGRSFRCSWGPNGQLVHSGKIVSQLVPDEEINRFGYSHTVVIERPFTRKRSKEQVEEELKVHLSCSINSSESQSTTPFYQLPKCNRLVSCMHQYIEKFSLSSEDSQEKEYTQILWKLVNSLWGQEHDFPDRSFTPIRIRDDPRDHDTMSTIIEKDIYREGISRWFQEAVSNKVDRNIDQSSWTHEQGLDYLYELLSARHVEEAVYLAFEFQDCRLATLLSQAQIYADENFRRAVLEQIKYWEETNALQHLDSRILRLYCLLGGDVIRSSPKHLDWLRALGLFLWYSNGPGQCLGEAVKLYEAAVDQNEVKRANPWWCQNTIDENENYDTLYELMKLSCDVGDSVNQVLSPRGHTSDCMDYRLAWHLCCMLKAIGFKISSSWESHIASCFVLQLEALGLWEWSVYVALNLPSELQREITVKEILRRHSPDGEKELQEEFIQKREFLVNYLHVPNKWLEEAQAIRALYDGRYAQEIAHLIASCQWNDAHRSVILRLSPICIFQHDHSILIQLLEEIEIGMYNTNEIIGGWNEYGGVILEYLRLTRGMNEQQLVLNEDLLERIIATCSRLRTWKSLNTWCTEEEESLEKVCISSMLTNLSQYCIQLKQQCSRLDTIALPESIDYNFVQEISEFSNEDAFGENYRERYLNSLCTSFTTWRSICI